MFGRRQHVDVHILLPFAQHDCLMAMLCNQNLGLCASCSRALDPAPLIGLAGTWSSDQGVPSLHLSAHPLCQVPQQRMCMHCTPCQGHAQAHVRHAAVVPDAFTNLPPQPVLKLTVNCSEQSCRLQRDANAVWGCLDDMSAPLSFPASGYTSHRGCHRPGVATGASRPTHVFEAARPARATATTIIQVHVPPVAHSITARKMTAQGPALDHQHTSTPHTAPLCTFPRSGRVHTGRGRHTMPRIPATGGSPCDATFCDSALFDIPGGAPHKPAPEASHIPAVLSPAL